MHPGGNKGRRLWAVLSIVVATGISHPASAGASSLSRSAHVSVAPARARGALGPLINIPQTWNNCGPASIAEILAFWGINRTQDQVRVVLRVNGIGRGMSPYGVPGYARSVGVRALVGVGGSETLIKDLISNGFPVIVSQLVSLADPIGHYRPIEAYDNRQGIFTSSDPYLGPGHVISYVEFATIWTRTGNGFIVLYPSSLQSKLAAVLAAAKWSKSAAYRRDLAQLKAGRRHTAGVGMPAELVKGYHYLGMAWDEVQLGHKSAAKAYLRLAVSGGANPIEVGWIRAAI
ncbi:MAG: C39 family peptidase [Chloroflexota bacterium]